MREKEFIKQSYRTIFYSVGFIGFIVSLLVFTPLTALIYYREEIVYARNFIYVGLVSSIISLFFWRYFKPKTNITLSVQEGGIIVLISWLYAIVVSAIPIKDIMSLSFSNAIFESVSGWTTTGLSVINVENAPKIILLWRSIIQLLGGVGLAIIMMSAIIRPIGTGVSVAEGRSDQLVPHVKQSARLIIIIYVSYAIAGIAAYYFAGMGMFDAINHSFCAISTGGFSTKVDSLGHWNSVAIEAVSLPLMFLGNLSFVTAWILFKGNFKAFFRNGEVKLQFVLLPISIVLVFLKTSSLLYPLTSKAIRVSIFETVSALTTTGFSTVSYANWNSLGIFILLILMLIGGGTCSTAGGIKQFRIYTLYKYMVHNLKTMFYPENQISELYIWEEDEKKYLNDTRLKNIALFVFLYFAFYVVGVLVLTFDGFSLKDSLFEMASSLSTVGLSVGVTSSTMPLPSLWSEIIAMFMGRLEFSIVIISFVKIFSDMNKLRKFK